MFCRKRFVSNATEGTVIGFRCAGVLTTENWVKGLYFSYLSEKLIINPRSNWGLLNQKVAKFFLLRFMRMPSQTVTWQNHCNCSFGSGMSH